MADSTSCHSPGALAGAIIGSILGTLLVCFGSVIAYYYVVNRKQNKKRKAEVECEMQTPPPGTPKKSMRDQVTMIDSFKLERKHFGTQKSFSMENVNGTAASVGVRLEAADLAGLGFEIKGNATDGIYVKSVAPNGPAHNCGNVLIDDRIRSLTINFEDMVFTDAVTLLSYASPYKVKLVLERSLESGELQTVDSYSGSPPRVHPLFRSNTLAHCHFNSSRSPSPPSTHCSPNPRPTPLSPPPPPPWDSPIPPSAPTVPAPTHSSTQPFAPTQSPPPLPSHGSPAPARSSALSPPLPPSNFSTASPSQSHSPPPVPYNDYSPPRSAAFSVSPTPKCFSSTPQTHPTERTALPNAPLSTENAKTEESVNVTIDKEKIEAEEGIMVTVKIVEEEISSERKDVVVERKEEEKKMISSDYSSENSYKGEDRSYSSVTTDSLEEKHSGEERDEVARRQSLAPSLSSTASSLPLSIASSPAVHQTRPSPPKGQPARQSASSSAIPVKRIGKTISSTQRPGEVNDSRGSRIPKRSDSIKTPGMERKLPSALRNGQPKKEEEPKQSSDIWNRLYHEKKKDMRRPREMKSPEPAAPAKENNNYGTLNRERQERLQENEEILERQREELRQLGVL